VPLAAPLIKRAIAPLFTKDGMPSEDPIGKWCTAYADAVKTVLAGPVKLAAGLVPQHGGGDGFFGKLDAAFRTMWMSAVWVGPGVTAVTTVVPPLQPFLLALTPALITSFDRDIAPSLIAEALHTYTLSITVTVTPPTGTPFIVPLT
jgi:hypothetical protein